MHIHTHTQKTEAAVVGEKLPVDCDPREQSEGGEPSYGRGGLPSVEVDPGKERKYLAVELKCTGPMLLIQASHQILPLPSF